MKSIVIIAIALGLATSVAAQDMTTRAGTRQVNQRARIHDGRTSGEITRREQVALNSTQRHIRRSEREVRADGDVTRIERRKLERKQDRASRHIRRVKYNQANL